MKIGIIGLGKLGLPVALAIESKGHKVYGFDNSGAVMNMVMEKKFTYKEVDAQEMLEKSALELKPVDWLVENCDIVFMAIQTPHEEKYEGTVRIPKERADFNYRYLQAAVSGFSHWAIAKNKKVPLVIISTVLPGTIEREIKPYLNPDFVKLVYNPFFIAMGTVIYDFLNPEFVLMGVEDEEAANILQNFYSTIHSKPFAKMPIVDAELTKVSYNTFIGMKIAFVNTLMEICYYKDGNVDNVTNALKMATDRLISPKYMSAGMGDGGGCHPRDNIAMSYLAKELNLSHNLFEDIMQAREDQTEFLAHFIIDHKNIAKAAGVDLPVFILGKSFKPETNIQTGSPAILLANILAEKGIDFQHLEEDGQFGDKPVLVFVATMHKRYVDQPFPQGSVVIDPFGFIPEREGVKVIKIGRN